MIWDVQVVPLLSPNHPILLWLARADVDVSTVVAGGAGTAKERRARAADETILTRRKLK